MESRCARWTSRGRTNLALSLTAFGGILAGCASPGAIELPIDHPANPAAAQSPLAPASTTLDWAPAPSREAGAAESRAGAQQGHHRPADTPPQESNAAATPRGEAAGRAAAAPASAAAFTCPMHPEVTRDKPGRCPICGMNLVAKEPGEQPTEGPHESHNH